MLEYTVEDTKKYGFIYFGLTHAYIRLSDIITKYVPPTKDRYDVYYTTVGQYCVWKFTPAGKQSKFFTNLIYMESDNEYNESAEQTIPEDSSWGEYTRHYHIITNKKYISTRAKATVILDHTKYYETENQAAIPYAFEDDEYIPEPGYKKSQACFVKCCNGSYDFDLKHLMPDTIKETEKQGIKLSIETDPKNIEIKHLDICMLVNNIDPNTGNKIFNYPMVFNFRPRGTVPQTHKLSLKFKFFTDNPLKNNNPVVSSEEWVKCWTGTDSGRSAYFYRDKHHYFSGNPFHELPCYEEYTFWSREREGKEDTNTFFWSDQTTPMQPANGELPEGYIFDLYNSQNHTTFGGARNQLDLLAYGIPNGYDDYSMPALRLLPRYFENNSWGYKPLIQVEDISDQIDSLFTDIPQITSQNHKLFRIQCPHIYDGYDTLKINGIIARMDFTEAEFDTLFENSQWFTLSIGIHDVNQQIYQDDHESRSDPIVEAIYITKLNED